MKAYGMKEAWTCEQQSLIHRARKGGGGGWAEGGRDGTPLYKLYRYVQPFLLKLGIEFNCVDVKYGKGLCSLKPSSLNNL